MVIIRHIANVLKDARPNSRVMASLCLSFILSACGGGDTTTLSDFGSSGTSSSLGIITNASDDDPSSGTGSTGGSSGGLSTSSGDSSAGDIFDLPGATAGLIPSDGSSGSGSDGELVNGLTSNPTPVQEFPDSARPQAIRLQTLEEVSIDGAFELFGESNGLEFPEQTFSVVTQPSNGTVFHNAPNRQFTYAPAEDFFGEDFFIYSTGPGLAARVTIVVIDVNDPPVIFDDVQRVTEQGTPYNELLIATDPDNEPLTYSAVNLPSWLSLDSTTGLLSGTPKQDDVGLFESIGFSVVDAEGLSSSVSGISIEVIDVNDPPTINVDQFPEYLDASETINVNLYPDDPDGDLVRLSVESNDFVDVTVTGSTITVIANEVPEVTKLNLVVEAADLLGRAVREIIPLTIYPKNSTGRGRTLRGQQSGEGIHLVVLGDGYRLDQQSQFRKDVEALIKKMQGDIGMLTHFSAWNVHMVETPSQDAGIDDNHGADISKTVFNTGYFCKGVQRLVCGDQSKMFETAIVEYPNFDQIVVLVNDVRYGGSGGNVAISSAASLEIALHEMGHSIAGLADEYSDGYIPGSSMTPFVEGSFANVSTSSDRKVVPWKHWISGDSDAVGNAPTGVGVFEGAYYQDKGFYRPTKNSLMRSYDGLLGPVNAEQWALSVYSMANPILDLSPVNRLVNRSAGEVIEFSVLPLFESAVQSVEWRLDSKLIPHSEDKRPGVKLSLSAGEYNLSVKIADVSGLIRKPEPHAGVFEWNWTIVVR